MKRVNPDELNAVIADAANWSDADEEMRNWFATQHGKYFVGIEAEENRLRLFLRRVFGQRCPCCGGRSRTIAKRRRLASYCDDAKNWLVSCQECFDHDTWRLEHDWNEYYSMVY